MLAHELLLVLGLAISGAVTLPVGSTTNTAPAVLSRDLNSEIHAAVLDARAFGKKPKAPKELGGQHTDQNKWANPMLPGMVYKSNPPKLPDMESGWSKPSKPSKPSTSTSKPSGGKPPKYPTKKGKRDVDEEAVAIEARAFGKKPKAPKELGGQHTDQNKWANPMLPGMVYKSNPPKLPDMESGWSKPSKPSKPSTSKPSGGKPPKYPTKKGKRDVDEEAEESAEYYE